MSKTNEQIYAEECDDLRAELTAARTEIDRLLTLTSEQATEIVGKDKQIERLSRDRREYARDIIASRTGLGNQSVLLKKADIRIAELEAALKAANGTA